MEITSINQKTWEKFVKDNKGSFLQSFSWAKYLESLGNKVIYLSVKDKEEIKAVALLEVRKLPKGTCLFCVKGPVLDWQNTKVLDFILEEIKKIALKEKSVFLRIEPETNEDLENKLIKLGFIKPQLLLNQISPQDTLILNLEKSEGEILSLMKPKTRYNIRLAEKHGVRVYKSNDIKDIDKFYKLSLETGQRNKIKILPKEYYNKIIEILGEENSALFVALYQGKPLSSIIVIFWNNLATYLYGASSSQNRNLMANYLVQWEAIKETKKRDIGSYDFWGIAPLEVSSKQLTVSKQHPWAGVTRFKKGFNGEEIHFPGSWDLVYNQTWYNLFSKLTKLKKIL